MRWTSRGQIIHAEKSRPFAEVDRNRPPTAIKVATRAAARGGYLLRIRSADLRLTPGQQETASVNQWKPTCTKTH